MTVASSTSRRSSSTTANTNDLHFHVNQIPNFTSILLFGCQQMLICISGLLVIPFIMSEAVCAGTNTIALRVKLIAATFVTSGIATIVQTTFGLRLCILHGPSFAFLPTLIAYKNLPENDCSVVDENEFVARMLLVQGSLFVGILIMPLLGLTGLVGVIASKVGPITICPLMILLNVGTMPTLVEKLGLHWIAALTFAILIVIVIFMENVMVPIPYFSLSERRVRVSRLRVFGQFPYLIGIAIAWLICLLMTITNFEPAEGEARIDKNATTIVMQNTPWFQVPYPCQFGMPTAAAGLTLGFVASALACMMESIGDYGVCARVSLQRRPPSSAINRAIIVEGFGCGLAALMGVGTGVTTYAENIALMHVTKVASRVTMQCAGVFLIIAGLFTKIAAFLASIPDAVVGGVLAMGMSMILGVGLSNLCAVDLRLSRNLTIMGSSLLLGMAVPQYFEKHPIRSGVATLDDVLNMLFRINMLVGSLTAFVLDNVVGGATREQRGFPSLEEKEILVDRDDDGYAFPPFAERFLQRYPFLTRLPFIPSLRSLHTSSTEVLHTKF